MREQETPWALEKEEEKEKENTHGGRSGNKTSVDTKGTSNALEVKK